MKISKNNTKQIYITTGLVIFLIFLVSLSFYYLLFPLIQKTEFYSKVNNFYRDNTWVTYTSKNAKFSFNHPLNWPVTRSPFLEYKDKNRIKPFSSSEGNIEDLVFNEEWYPNAGGPKLGFVKVEKIPGINSLNDYLKKEELLEDRWVDMFIKGAVQKVFLPAPKLEYLKINGIDAVKITLKQGGLARFSVTTADYRLFRDGFIYKFATIDSQRFIENKEKNAEIFNKIISSIQFID